MNARPPAPIRLIAGDAEQLCNELHGVYRAYSARPDKLAKVLPPQSYVDILRIRRSGERGRRTAALGSLHDVVSTNRDTEPVLALWLPDAWEPGWDARNFHPGLQAQSARWKWLRSWNRIGLFIEDTI